LDSKARIVVAVNGDGAIFGMAVGRIHFQDTYVPNVSASIDMVFVEKPYRRRGVGTQLVLALCQFFAAHGVEDISLRYVIGNRQAEQFWSRFGFEPRIITVGARRQDVERKICGIGWKETGEMKSSSA
jgi:GNAT superfamily N-acetyltransferase